MHFIFTLYDPDEHGFSKERKFVISKSQIVAITDLSPDSSQNMGPRSMIEYIGYGKRNNCIKRAIVKESASQIMESAPIYD